MVWPEGKLALLKPARSSTRPASGRGAVHDLLEQELQRHDGGEPGGEGDRGAAAARQPGGDGEHGPDGDDDLGAGEEADGVGERLAGEGPRLDGAGDGEVAGEAVVGGGERGEGDAREDGSRRQRRGGGAGAQRWRGGPS